MVVVERYALSFWWNGHEERVQCATAHYRDAKTTSYLPKISFETVLSDPLEMPIVSARSLIVNRRFFCTNSLIWLTCSSQLMLMVVWGVPSHQHVLCLFWSLCTTYNHFSATWSITEGLLQHSERFRNWNFTPQTKFNGTSLLNKFRHCKNRKNHF